VGEFVLVEWQEDTYYPAYIIEKTGPARFRVHYDGYATRWDEDVSLDRIKGRVEGAPPRPPAPTKVARAQGVQVKTSSSAAPASSKVQVSQYHSGDRIKVKWRGATYAATVIGVLEDDQYRVHYDGYESAWDETIEPSRIVDKR
jgi:hypothetical protein